MKNVLVLPFLIFVLLGCSPTQPAADSTVVNAPVVESTAPEVVAPEEEVAAPVEQAEPERWEYKTLVTTARVSGPAGEKLQGSSCVDSTTTAVGGSICLLEDASTALMERLNSLGAEGWELVDVVYSPENDAAVYFFKRVIVDAP